MIEGAVADFKQRTTDRLSHQYANTSLYLWNDSVAFFVVVPKLVHLFSYECISL